MVEPHPDQEDDEVAIDVGRETASLDLHGPLLRRQVVISMNLQRRLAPEAKDESCTPTGYSIWTTTNLGYMNDQAAPNGGYAAAGGE
jgi:hypothetical protein